MIGSTVAKPDTGNLPEFNLTYYHNAILEGYKYFHYINYDTFGVIEPVRFPMRTPRSYSVHVSDEEAKDMACGIDDWKVYYKRPHVL